MELIETHLSITTVLFIKNICVQKLYDLMPFMKVVNNIVKFIQAKALNNCQFKTF